MKVRAARGFLPEGGSFEIMANQLDLTAAHNTKIEISREVVKRLWNLVSNKGSNSCPLSLLVFSNDE